jgi:hypothetical protein
MMKAMGLVRATSSGAQLPAGIALRESGFQARIYTDKDGFICGWS